MMMDQTAAEIRAINADVIAMMRGRGRGPPPSEARAPEPIAVAPQPESASGQDWSWLPPSSAAHGYKDQTLKMIVAFVEPVSEAIGDLTDAIGKLRKENQELRIALAELRADVAGTTARSNETSAIVARLRIEGKGEKGDPGLMGPPGLDGPRGEKGEKGNRGQRGFELSGFKLDVAAYHAVPVFYDGSEGAPLNLRPFFERYNADTEGDEIDLAVEQAAHSRVALELEVERTRKGLPAR